MRKTINFAKDANPHFGVFCMCIPFPGTKAYNTVKKEGKFLVDVDNGTLSGFFEAKPSFETSSTKAKDVAFYHKQAYREFYFNTKKALDILMSIKSFREFTWVASTSFSVFVNNMLLRHKNNE